VEVVNSFTGDDALMDFRRWVLAPDTDAIKAAAKKGKGRGRKKGAAVEDEGGFVATQTLRPKLLPQPSLTWHGCSSRRCEARCGSQNYVEDAS
jgi:hypothetical protein